MTDSAWHFPYHGATAEPVASGYGKCLALSVASIGACDHCHDAIHRGDLHVQGNADEPDGLTFTDRDGKLIDYRTPAPAAPAEPTPAPDQPYIRPLGERLDHSYVWVRPSKAG